MIWMVALLLRVVLMNSISACLCHRVLCFPICKEDDEQDAGDSSERSCCQTLVSTMPRQVLPA